MRSTNRFPADKFCVARCLAVVAIAALGFAGPARANPPAAAAAPAGPSAAPAAKTATPYKQAPGPHEVATFDADWHDADRDRTLPVRVYYPAQGDGPAPVVVFSHGLGGSRRGYAYLGQHWASHGYVSIHLQHPGSDESVFQGQDRPLEALRGAAADPRRAADRGRDVKFALDECERLHAGDGPLAGRLDLERVGMAGHSFGANTTLMVCGQRFGPRLLRLPSFRDDRIRAAIPMSAPVPGTRRDPDYTYGEIRVPLLHMTGTLDESPIGDTAAADRRIPFDNIAGVDQYLVTFEGGDHMIFSGRVRRGPAAGLGPELPGFGGDATRDAAFQDLIRQGTTAFWDAYLRDDKAARAWLMNDYADVLGADGKLELRPAEPAR